MVDKYDCQLPELNEERICDNPPQSTHPKMTNTCDNAYDSATVELSREVECDYPTGVGSGEGDSEIAGRRMGTTSDSILEPGYGTATCSKEHVSSIL